MNLSSKFCFLYFILFFVGCLNDNKEKKLKTNFQKAISKQNNIVIIGKSDDLPALNDFSLSNNSYLFGKEHKDFKKNIVKDSLHLVLDSINKPQLMEVWAFSDSTYYKTKILITAGDTINFEIKNGHLKFRGKNAIQNNFYIKLYRTTPDFNKNQYKGNIYTYKKKTDSIYLTKANFFNHYIEKHRITSEDFITKVRADIKHSYLEALMNPRTIKVKGFDFYHSEPLSHILQKEQRKKEGLLNYKEYFDNVSIEDFKKPELLSNPYFKDNINPFIRDYFDDSGHSAYSKEKLLAEKEFIENNFEGELKNYAIARMIRDYNKKGFGYSINNIKFMKKLIDEYEAKFDKLDYIDKMNEIKTDLNAFNFKLSEAALNSKLISTIGDTLTLKEIFSRSTERIRVIDFWASWCHPCISEIKKAKDFKDKLSVENNVEWIYLSIDKDKKEWLKKSNELDQYLNVRNQYLILDGKNSSLANSLKVDWIPKYVIFNKQNKIVLNNAPLPSDSIIFSKIIKSLN